MLPCHRFLIQMLSWKQPNRLLRTLVPLAKSFDILKSSEFDTKVFDAGKPVVVDFHAEWCGPCRTLAPLLEEAVNSTDEGVDLARVDIDRVGEVAIKYGVTAVPAVFLVKDGKVIDKFIGLQDSKFIRQFVQRAVSK